MNGSARRYSGRSAGTGSSTGLLVIGAIISVQLGAALAETLFDQVTPVGVAAVRNTVAALVLVAIWRPWRRHHGTAALRSAVGLGLALATMNVAFYLSLDLIPMGVAVTVEFLGPITLAVMRSSRRADLAWAALALIGVAMVAEPWGGGVSIDPVGFAWAAVAAVAWAAYILMTERTGREFQGGEGLTIALVVAALVTAVPGFAGQIDAILSPTVLGIGIVIAVLSTALPYSLETEALRRMPASLFGVLMSLQPAVAAIIGLLVLSQSLTAIQVAAIMIVVTASVGAVRTSAARIRTPNPG